MNTLKLQRLATVLSISILSLSFIAAITGILLAFYYEPAASAAFDSIEQITTEVPYGWLVRGLHDISGNGIIAVCLIQIVVMFLGERFRPSWLTAWISGILLTLTAIALGWTAMILDWSQLGYWRLSIELGTIESIPLIGMQLREILTGGGAISTATVERLYTLHSYVLSIGAIALSVIHLGGLLVQEREENRYTNGLAADEATLDGESTSEVEMQRTQDQERSETEVSVGASSTSH